MWSGLNPVSRIGMGHDHLDVSAMSKKTTDLDKISKGTLIGFYVDVVNSYSLNSASWQIRALEQL